MLAARPNSSAPVARFLLGSWRDLVVIIALAASATGAIAQNAQHGSESTKEFKAADMNMMKNMDAAPYTGNPDMDFRTHMIPHHEGAIAMAKIALKYATALKARPEWAGHAK